MIVRERPSAIQLLLTLRGSILGDIWKPLLFCTSVAAIITLSGGRIMGFKIHLDVAPFTLIGMTLAIFLGFRNNVCYDRYWEGRKLWGDVINASRNLARQILAFVDAQAEQTDTPRRLIYRIIAIAHVMRHELRGSTAAADLLALLDHDTILRISATRSPTTTLLIDTGEELKRCRQQGWIEAWFMATMDAELDRITTALGGCERIKSTPVPFAYTLLLHRTIFIYCLLVPFGLLDSCGTATPLISTILAYTFFGLDAIGSKIEQPFGTLPYDLPLSALCRNIEIDLRHALRETDIPTVLQPVKHILC